MSAFLRLTVVETKLFFREPIVVFLALAFAPLLIVVLGLIPTLGEPDPDLDFIRPITLYVPIIITMGIALFSLDGLSQLLASYREKGVLRRMRTTPVRPVVLLFAQLLMATVLSATTLVIVVVIAWLAFDVDLPRNPAGYIISFLLLAIAVFAVGLLIAAVSPSAKSANAIGILAFFPLAFFAGIWLPRPNMNDALRTISDLTPLGAGVQSLQDAAAGGWPQPLHLAVMLGWTVVAGGLAARYFRWE